MSSSDLSMSLSAAPATRADTGAAPPAGGANAGQRAYARRSKVLLVTIWTIMILLVAAAWVAAYTLSERDQRDALLRAQRDTGNLARIIAEQTTRAISGADRILTFIGYDLYRLGGDNPLLRDFMKNATLDSDLLIQLAYADANGVLVQTSVDQAPPQVNLSDREHFRVLKEGLVQGLYISRPVFGRASHKWSIQLARKVTAPDGGFGGMIVASMDPFYFSRAFDDLDVGPHGVVTIFGTDGILRARTVMDEKIIGQDVSKSTVFAASRERPEGFLRSVSAVDGVARLVSFRRLDAYPLVVLAGFDEADFMSETWARQRAYTIGAAAATVTLLAMALLITWQSRRQERGHAALLETARDLRASRQTLSDIAETATDWFWEMDAGLHFTALSGVVGEGGEAACRNIGRRWDDIVLRAEGEETAWMELQQALKDRLPFRDFEFTCADRVMSQTPSPRIWSVSGKPLFDDAGRFAGYRGSGSDVTERKRAEWSLAASEHRYRAMFEAVGQPIITTDQDGRIIGFNPAAEAMTGFRDVEVIGQDVGSLMPEPYRSAHHGFMAAYRRSGRDIPVMGLRELTIQRKDGGLIPVEISLSSWRSDGQEHFIGILRDITQTKQIADSLRQARDSAEHANRMKSEFLATISHEIRTPMNGVLGTLTLLDGEELTATQRRLAEGARRSAENLLRLLDDILDFSKLEAGRISIEEADCSPAQVAEQVLEVFRPIADEKRLDLTVRMLPNVPDAVVTDAARLRQILFNLVGNAIKFTPRGHVAVRARRGADRPDGRFLLKFEVEDSGIGIPADAIPHLFDRFTQADSSITRRYGGTGLGLAICKELSELLGGSIRVDSTPGRGSVFHVSIACAPGNPEALRDRDAAGEADTTMAPLPTMRVLVVDDNEINRDIVRGMMERAGHAVVTAADGHEAVRLASEEVFDLVIMDVQMPELDGLDTTRQIRRLPASQGQVPVIALTAHASGSSRPECVDAGMDGFVTKPVRPQSLMREVAAVLADRARHGDESASATSERSPEPVTPELAPAPVAPPRADLIDQDQLRTIIDALGADGWPRVRDSFITVARLQAGHIAGALDSGTAHRNAAHTLKGLAWNVGARRLGDTALAVEKAGQDAARALLPELESVLAETIAMYEPLDAGAMAAQADAIG